MDIDGGGCFAIIGSIALLILLGSGIGKKIEEQSWKTECVKRGVAEWQVDDEGVSKFVWLANKKAQSE